MVYIAGRRGDDGEGGTEEVSDVSQSLHMGSSLGSSFVGRVFKMSSYLTTVVSALLDKRSMSSLNVVVFSHRKRLLSADSSIVFMMGSLTTNSSSHASCPGF